MSALSELPEVTCPACSSLDWARNGFGLRADGPRIDLGRFGPAGRTDETWHCRACGQALRDATLARALGRLEQMHLRSAW
jgi:hypothetical protein